MQNEAILKEKLNQDSQPVQPLDQKKGSKNSKTGLIILLILGLFAFIGVGIGAYLLNKELGNEKSDKEQITTQDDSPEENEQNDDSSEDPDTEQEDISTDPYKDWKTYENDYFNFSLKYPPDWELVEEVTDVELFNTYDYQIYFKKDDSNYLYIRNYIEGPQMPTEPDNIVSSPITMQNDKQIYRINKRDQYSYLYSYKAEQEGWEGYWDTYIDIGENDFVIYLKLANENLSYLSIADNIIKSIEY